VVRVAHTIYPYSLCIKTLFPYRYLCIRNQETLRAIFSSPVASSIIWSGIEKSFIASGCKITEGRDSRVRVMKNGVFAVFHRPLPEKETNKGAVISVRRLQHLN